MSQPTQSLTHSLLLTAALACFGFSSRAQEKKVDFAKDIEPILSANCFKCHGPDNQESGLRLDRKQTALKGGERGTPILAGRPSESLLFRAINGGGEDVPKMPKDGDPLENEQIDLIRAWIEQGAERPDDSEPIVENDPRDHWAFKAPVRPAIPNVKANVKNPAWVQTPIDAFVLAKLEKVGLEPSPKAAKSTLLRRLNLDLVGLPPSIQEADAFISDGRATALEKQVERLLKSPHYGERWGRHWLDAARYADSDGFEKDKPRSIWNYRDWVVSAFNRDLPYDRFIIEQLAGDLLDHPTEDQLVATGFLRNSMLNEEGGVDPEQFRMDAIFDRMEAIGKGVLGLTVQCAQCHTHKFDPISHEEYYRMFAFLNNDHEASMIAYTADEQRIKADLLREMREVEEGLQHTNPDWSERLAAWEELVRDDQPEWKTVRVENSGDNGTRYYYYEDDSLRASSYAPTKWTATFRGTNDIKTIGAFRLEQLTDPNLPGNGPGRSLKGMSALTEFNVEAIDARNPANKIDVKFVKATADFSNETKDLEPEFDDKSGKKRVYGPIEFAIDGKDDTAWGIDAGPGRRNQPRKAVFIPEKSIHFENGVVFNFRLKMNHGGWNSDDNQNHNLGRFRLSVTSVTNAVADPVPAGVREILAISRDKRSPHENAALFSYWRTTVPEFKQANEKIEALWKKWPEGAPTLTMLARGGEG
ncbi:MAG: DUF1549 domain-containing protein, partial [Limisphaerales bacterium]